MAQFQLKRTKEVVVFRVDAGIAMGLGHLSRCLTLATALHGRGVSTLFLISPETARWADMITKRGFDFRVLDLRNEADPTDRLKDRSSLGWGQALDAEACRRHLPERVSWLVVDHYALDKSWEVVLRASVQRLMVIDDIADRKHNADLLLDQNCKSLTSYAHLIPPGCEALIGPRYALLRPEFAQERTADRSGGVARFNIFMGGTDSEGITLRVLDDIAGSVNWEKVDVILGAKCPHLDAVRQRVNSLPAAELHIDSDRVAGLFAFADIGIGAGGVASLERCCVGLPSLGISVADNQVAGLDALMKLGVTECLGASSDLRVGQIGSVLNALIAKPDRLRQMSKMAMEIVDGQGAFRVANIMLTNSRV